MNNNQDFFGDFEESVAHHTVVDMETGEVQQSAPATTTAQAQPAVSVKTEEKKVKLIDAVAKRFQVDGLKLYNTLKDHVFRSNGQDDTPITEDHMMSLLVIIDQYGLNPFTKEIYAFPDKRKGIIPIVGVDGWTRIINQHPQFDGVEFRFSDKTDIPKGALAPCYEWIECAIYRKDRRMPIVIREYLDEAYKVNKKDSAPGPWQFFPKRMLRHKALIQCARVAFSYSGIMDEDSYEDMKNSGVINMGAAEEVNTTAQHQNIQYNTNPHTPKNLQSAQYNIDKFVGELIARLPQIGLQAALNYAATRIPNSQELAVVQQKIIEADNNNKAMYN